jgi:hypothetical protein
MRRIRVVVLLQSLLIAFAISSAQAVPLRGSDGNFSELVSTPAPTGAAALGSSHPEVPGYLATVSSAMVDATMATLAPIGAAEPSGPGGAAPGGVYTSGGFGQPDNRSGGRALLLLLRRPASWDDFSGVQGRSAWSSAPEPGTFLLFGAALAGAGLAGWHQRRRAQALGRTGP